MKRALITGISGMDGSHLSDLLLSLGYEVHGVVRRCSRPVTDRIEHIADQLVLHQGDLLDQTSLDHIVQEVQPDEVYNLAAQSFVGASWQQPVLTSEITGLGALRVLQAVRAYAPEARFYQASSSEQFGNAPTYHQNEHTPFAPRSPYGVAKAFAHQIAVNYRESYGMHISCGILFNHESERRGREFVTRKISLGVAEIAAGRQDRLLLGNLEASRDWGYAPDYVEAMWRMLQQSEPSDYVVATRRAHSVGEFAAAAFKVAGLGDWREYVQIDPQFSRPAELHTLRGDYSKAQQRLGWRPTKGFEDLVRAMVLYDLGQLAVAA